MAGRGDVSRFGVRKTGRERFRALMCSSLS